jgi:hypothetical protein
MTDQTNKYLIGILISLMKFLPIGIFVERGTQG